MSVEDKVKFSELYDEYAPLLTKNKREVFEMHYKLDLSLGEIAEIRGVSRQSASDCIAGVKEQLSSYEEKLGVLKLKRALLSLAEGLEDEEVKSEIKKVLDGDI